MKSYYLGVLALGVFGLFIGSAGFLHAAPTMKAVCPQTDYANVRCLSLIVVDTQGAPLVNQKPQGIAPKDLLKAYKLTAIASGTPIIGIVDAHDDPYIQNDLNKYSRAFNLPDLPACPGAIKDSPTPCFQRTDEYGGTNYSPYTDWHDEITLDVEIAHAICQNCSILLVEASTTDIRDAGQSVDTAVALGADEVSNSYGIHDSSCGKYADCTADDKDYYNHPGVAIVAATGDEGYGNMYYPGSSTYVTGVGGTDIEMQNGKIVSETAWSGTGSGCSAYEQKPAWETDTDCTMRMTADISAMAVSGSSGAAIYDSLSGGWVQVGGTSLSSPIIAAVYALAGPIGKNQVAPQVLYKHAKEGRNLNDITEGSNGSCAKHPYYCTAGAGYDGPTGLGTPHGVNAF